MAPYIPYPIDGTVYDIDGSTKVAGATVIAFNVDTGERTSTTTDSSGDFLIDMANFASGYSDGDRIQGTISYGSGSGIRCMSRRHTIDTAVGAYSAGDVVLHPGTDPFLTCHITFAGHSNTHTAKLYVDFYDRTNDVLVFRIEAPLGGSASFPFGYLGQKMDGGFIKVFEDETAGRSVVSVISK
jgi:hypothetical protein